MLELVYASAATRPFTAAELQELLIKARTKNAPLGVSGLLLHHEGSFLQVLEGEEEAVEPLFDTIARDPRHSRVLSIRRGTISERTFGQWSMGFVGVNKQDIPRLSGFSSFLQTGRLEAEPSADRLREVFSAFRGGRWRQAIR